MVITILDYSAFCVLLYAGRIRNIMFTMPRKCFSGSQEVASLACGSPDHHFFPPGKAPLSCLASLAYFACGECIVWTSPVLPKLMSNNTDINPLDHPVNSFETSLIVGLLVLGSMISPFVCSKPLDIIGRRNTTALFSSLCMIALIITAFASNIIWILVARLIIGICVGGIWIAVPIFLSEISNDENRGKIGCFLGLFLPLGQLYSYILGPFFSVRVFTLFFIIPLVLHLFLILTFVSESPVHLLSKGNRNKVVESLRRYRGNLSPQEMEKQIYLLEKSYQQSKKSGNAGLITLITHQPTRRGFLIAMGMLLVQAGSGIGIILPFLGPIFEEAQTGLSGAMTAILAGCLKVAIYFIVTQIVERTGRKPLMFYSSVSCSISLFLLGLYFFMKENNYSSHQSFLWLPVASIFFYIISYSFGLGPVPLATVGELFNSNVRSTAVSTGIFFSRLFSALLLSFYPLVLSFIGNSGFMWFFSVSCALGAIFFHFCMPETKGKSFYEIQEIFRDKKTDCVDKPVEI